MYNFATNWKHVQRLYFALFLSRLSVLQTREIPHFSECGLKLPVLSHNITVTQRDSVFRDPGIEEGGVLSTHQSQDIRREEWLTLTNPNAVHCKMLVGLCNLPRAVFGAPHCQKLATKRIQLIEIK